jgi:hypothetical protein
MRQAPRSRRSGAGFKPLRAAAVKSGGGEARRQRVVKGLFRRTRPDGSRWELRDDDIAGCLRVPSGGSSRQSIVVVDATRSAPGF